MPRRARVYIPGLPYHIIQRGNNRGACFIEPENYQYYLDLWHDLSIHYHCQVHAYCLMTNHIASWLHLRKTGVRSQFSLI